MQNFNDKNMIHKLDIYADVHDLCIELFLCYTERTSKFWPKFDFDFAVLAMT